MAREAEPGPVPVYQEHTPHPALARHVERYWTASCRLGPEQTQHSTVLPDGCMDILFSLSGTPHRPDGAPSDPLGRRGDDAHAMGVEHIGGELSNGTVTAVHRGRRPGHGNRLARGTGGHGTAQTNVLRNG